MLTFRSLSWIALILLLLAGMDSCSYTIKVRDGDTAYERKQFAVAIPYFTKDYSKEKSRVQRGRIALKLGNTYQRINDPASALEWYRIAWDNQAGIDALKGYAYTLKMLERYPEASEAFVQLGEEIGSTYEYRLEIEACRLSGLWLSDTANRPYSVQGAKLNSRYGDYALIPTSNQALFFTSERPSPQSEDLYAWTGKPYADILIADDGRSAFPENFLNKINTIAHESNLILTPDLNTLFFTRCGGFDATEDQYCRIMTSNRTDDGWTDPTPLPFCSGTVNYGHPYPFNNGQSLLFASDDPFGFGGFDLYQSNRTMDGWSEPAILPPNINTQGDDMYPYLDADTLYFASDHHPGMGGLDIFSSTRLGPRSWSSPTNMKAPINSGSDDFGLVWLDNSIQSGPLRSGYLSSSRPGGLGGDDIYMVRERLVERPAPPVKEVTSYSWKLELHTLVKIYSTPDDPNSPVLGRRYLDGARVVISGGMDTTFSSPGNSPAILKINPGSTYTIKTSSPGYLNTETQFSTVDLLPDPNDPHQVISLEVVLDRRFVDREIVLENIYYDFDRWDIRTDAQPTLMRLASVLRTNPDIYIELASHTDCRGGTLYNQELSQRRAQSAVDYLISRGIDSNRLRARGYGESKPSNDCACSRCTEDEHQQNRRTTFRILQD